MSAARSAAKRVVSPGVSVSHTRQLCQSANVISLQTSEKVEKGPSCSRASVSCLVKAFRGWNPLTWRLRGLSKCLKSGLMALPRVPLIGLIKVPPGW